MGLSANLFAIVSSKRKQDGTIAEKKIHLSELGSIWIPVE